MNVRCTACGTVVNKLGDMHQCGEDLKFALDVRPITTESRERGMSFRTPTYVAIVAILAAALGILGTRIAPFLTPVDNAQYLPLVVGYLNGKIGAIAADDPASKADCLKALTGDEKDLLSQAPPGAAVSGVCVRLPVPTGAQSAQSTLPPQSHDSAGDSKTL